MRNLSKSSGEFHPWRLLLVCLAVAMLLPAVAEGQSNRHWMQGMHRSHPSPASRDSGAMMRLVRPLSATVDASVVQVFTNGRVVSLGTVVASDGYVLTKRSELSADPISLRLPSGQKVDARVCSVRRDNDLALLKIIGADASGWEIEPAKFATEEPPTGSFLISPGRSGFTIGLGVLGVSARHIGHQGRLGVRLYDAPSGPAMVSHVQPSSGAEEAGLQDGDQILKINGIEMFGSRSARRKLGELYPGEVVRLTIARGDDTIELDAQMSDETVLRESKNDAKVNGPRNVRLSGFDSVIQHDTVLAPNQCGGPLLDSSGNVIGINIARAGRVVSYALPSSLVTAEVISMLEEARRRERESQAPVTVSN